jgi:cytidylate kinase
MIRIIALEREFGSGGAAIARMLAERLRWTLWDQSLTAEVARLARVDPAAVEEREDRVDPLYYRLFRVFMRGSFEASLPVGLERFDADRMFALMQHVVENAAAAGNCVIVGRGAPYFLRDRDDVFSVFVFAPAADKVRRVCAAGKTADEASQLVETIDKERKTFVKKYYGVDWPCRPLYHLMVNSKVGEEAVADLILREIEILDRREIVK